MTFQPCAANSLAAAFPSPDELPVIRIVCCLFIIVLVRNRAIASILGLPQIPTLSRYHCQPANGKLETRTATARALQLGHHR